MIGIRKSKRTVHPLPEDCVHQFYATPRKLRICSQCNIHYTTYKSNIDIGNSLYRQGMLFSKQRIINIILSNSKFKESIEPAAWTELLSIIEEC